MTEELALGMSELATLLLTGDDVAESLCAVADIVARMLPDHPLVGVTLTRRSGNLVGGSGDAQEMLDEEARFGAVYDPALQAISTAQQISVPDVATEHRWGEYSSRMLAYGVKSIYAQPFSVDGEAIGALSLYSPRSHSFTEQAKYAADMTAEHIGVLLAVTIESARQVALTDQLRATLASRSVIDQALGALMAQHRCSRDAAFEMLREQSQRHNIRVATLAAEIIETMSGHRAATPRFIEPGTRSRTGRR